MLLYESKEQTDEKRKDRHLDEGFLLVSSDRCSSRLAFESSPIEIRA